jgi:nucleoside-diphosphate-sugar epimerase
MRVAVIGGSGFIGREVARELAAKGWPVTILDLEPPPSRLDSGIRHCDFDMTRSTWTAGDWARFDAVVIAAGLLGKLCIENPIRAWTVNVTATIALIDSLARASPAPRVVFLSSGSVYQRTEEAPPFVENGPVAARCVYTATKLAVEAALAAAARGDLLRALILRPFTVFGSDGISADRGHLLARWMDLGRAGQALTIHGDGSQVIDPVPVQRVAQACAAYLDRDDQPQLMTVNVTAGGPVTLLRLAELFVESGMATRFELQPSVRADSARGWGDGTALTSLLSHPLPGDPEEPLRRFLHSMAGSPGLQAR